MSNTIIRTLKHLLIIHKYNLDFETTKFLSKYSLEYIDLIFKIYHAYLKETETITGRKLKKTPKLYYSFSLVNNNNIAEYCNKENIILLNSKLSNNLKPHTQTFKETILHETSHAIHFQNNNNFAKYFISSKHKKSTDLRCSFHEGFANLISGEAYDRYNSIQTKLNDLDSLQIKSNLDNNTKSCLNFLNNSYNFGSFIFTKIAELKGRQYAIDYAFKESGFRPKDMQKDYEELCVEKGEKPIPLYQKIQKLESICNSTHTSTHPQA